MAQAPFFLAKNIYECIEDDEGAQELWLNKALEYATDSAKDDDFYSQLTSSTLNGQSFSQLNSMSQEDKMAICFLVVKMIKKRSKFNKKTNPIF